MRGEETREKLFVVKDRVNYGTRRGHLKGTIRWLLKRRGIDFGKGLFGPKGRERLRALRLQEIDIRLDELELVGSTIERLDSQIRDIVSKSPQAFGFLKGRWVVRDVSKALKSEGVDIGPT